MKKAFLLVALLLAAPVQAQFCGQPGFCNKGSSAPAFTPSALSPNYWSEPRKGGMFQSNAGTTPAASSGDVVGYLPDQSGNAVVVKSLADDTTRPVLTTTTGQTCVQFDGSNDVLASAAGTSLGSYNAGSSSWFVAIRSGGTTATSVLTGDFNSAAASNDFYSLMMNTATASTAGAGIRSSGSSAMVPLATAVQTGVYNGSNHVYGVVDSGTTLTPYLDGVAGTPVNYSIARTGTITEARFSVGSRVLNVASLPFPMIYCGQVVVNRVLTGSEIANLTTYMQGLF